MKEEMYNDKMEEELGKAKRDFDLRKISKLKKELAGVKE